MSQLLKQSTTTTIKMGPFLDASDGVTEETALTPVVEVAKNGGAFASRNSATSVAHDVEGYYDVELNATDTGTTGQLIVKAHDSANHLPVRHEFTIVPPNVYDSLVGGSDTLQANVTQLTGNSVQQTGGRIHAYDDSGNGLATSAEIAGLNDLSQSDILSDATPFAGANIDAAITSRSSHAASDVWSVASAEPTAVFAWGGSRGAVLDWLGALARNKITQDGSTQTLRDDVDGSDIAAASVSDDGTTFTRGEWS